MEKLSENQAVGQFIAQVSHLRGVEWAMKNKSGLVRGFPFFRYDEVFELAKGDEKCFLLNAQSTADAVFDLVLAVGTKNIFVEFKAKNDFFSELKTSEGGKGKKTEKMIKGVLDTIEMDKSFSCEQRSAYLAAWPEDGLFKAASYIERIFQQLSDSKKRQNIIKNPSLLKPEEFFLKGGAETFDFVKTIVQGIPIGFDRENTKKFIEIIESVFSDGGGVAVVDQGPRKSQTFFLR
jgi:hypothetical protein